MWMQPRHAFQQRACRQRNRRCHYGSTIALTFSENAFGVAGKDFYLYDDIDTTPVLVETFTFDDGRERNRRQRWIGGHCR
jgi:hypothetical protein